MAVNYPIYASYADNILAGITPTGTAPASTYSLTTFSYGNPIQRIRYGATGCTITWTLGSSKTGGVLVIPMHNITPGSSGVLTLTNGAGLSVAIAIPNLQVDGFPPTLAIDFTLSGNLTSNVWNLVISGNAANVIMGGAVAIYPKQTFQNITLGGSVQWQVAEDETDNLIETVNDYGSPYIQEYGTVNKTYKYTAITDATGIESIKNWFRGNMGRGRNGFFWPDPTITIGPCFGRWQKTLSITRVTPTVRSVAITMDEWPKGLAL